MSLLRQPCLISFSKNSHQKSNIATTSAAKHQRWYNFSSIKYKFLEKGAPLKDDALLFVVTKSTLSTLKKNREKMFQSYKSDLVTKTVEPRKYEAHNKVLNKEVVTNFAL